MMKKLLGIIFSLFYSGFCYCAPVSPQNGGTGVSNNYLLFVNRQVSLDGSNSSALSINSPNQGSRVWPQLSHATGVTIPIPENGLCFWDNSQNTLDIFNGTEWQEILTAQNVTGSGTITVTNNNGHLNIFGSGGDAPDAAYASFSTQNNSSATTFPGMNSFKPVYLGATFFEDQSTDFSNSFMTIDSVSTPVMTHTGASTQEFNVQESFSIRGAIATNTTFKFCIAIRRENGTVEVTDYCQLATINNIVDFIPGPKLGGNVLLSEGDSVFAEVENITNGNSIYAAFSNFSVNSVAGSIPDTNGLPQGTNNKYLTTNGGTSLASATGTITSGHLPKFSGTSGLIEDSGVSLSNLDLQYAYENSPYYPTAEIILGGPDGEFDIYAPNGRFMYFYDDGLYVSGSVYSSGALGNVITGDSLSIDPASTEFSVRCNGGKHCGALSFPRQTSADIAAIVTTTAPQGLGAYNTDTKILELWDGTEFRKFISTNLFSGDIAVATNGATTIQNNAITTSKIQNGAVDLASKITGVTPFTNGGLGFNNATTGDLFYASATNTAGKLSGVATGQVLVSGGVGVAPQYSATPTVSGISLTSPSNLSAILGSFGLVSSSSSAAVQKQQTLSLDGATAIADSAVYSAGTTNVITSFLSTDLIVFTARLRDGCAGGNDIDFAFYNGNFVALNNRIVPGRTDRYLINVAYNTPASSITISRTVACGGGQQSPLTLSVSGSDIQAASTGATGDYQILSTTKYSTVALKNSGSFGGITAGGLGGTSYNLAGILDYKAENAANVIASTVPVNIGPLQTQAITTGLNIRGTSGVNASTNWYRSTDQYPVLQALPNSHDDAVLAFDAYRDASNWRSSSANSSARFQKSATSLRLQYGVASVGSTLSWTSAIEYNTTNGNVSVPTGELSIDNAGKTLGVKSGSNACTGTVNLSGASTVISTTCAKTNDLLLMSIITPGGTPGIYSYTISNGVSATVTSTEGASDTSTLRYLFIHTN